MATTSFGGALFFRIINRMGPLTATRLLRQPKPNTAVDDRLPPPKVRSLWIGSVCVDPPILQAPMAGYTNYAFRQIVRELGGAGLLATEMVNAKGFVWMAEQKAVHPDRLWGVAEEPRPLAVQMWDNDPETLAKVGLRLRANTTSASSISTSAAPCEMLCRKPTAAPTCSASRNAWAQSSNAW